MIAFNLRPVTDFNEITYHFLEVVYCNAHNASRAATARAAPADRRAGPADTAYAAPSAGAPAAAMPAAGGSANDQVFAIFNGPQGHGPRAA